MNFKLNNKIKYLTIILNMSLILCLILFGCNKKKQHIYKIGILCGVKFFHETIDGFKTGMKEFGYIEGKNIIYDVKDAPTPVGNEKIIEKFIKDNVDLIFSFPTEASIEAKKVSEKSGIPVVFTNANIEGTGLVNSVREPGGNITGVRYPGPDIAVKRLEYLIELIPDVKKILIPFQRDYPIVSSQLDALKPVIASSNMTFEELPASDAKELHDIFNTFIKSKKTNFDAVLFIAEPLAVTPDAFIEIGKFAEQYKIPMGGVLMSVGDYASIFGVNVNIYMAGKQASQLVDKILNGIPAGKIPVVSAESYLQINYKAIKDHGLHVNEGMLRRADEIIR